MRKHLLICLLVLLCAGISCSKKDDPVTPKTTSSIPTYQDLTQRDHVLNNLELAYNERDLLRYGETLEDDNFTFFFGAADFAEGTVPEFWQEAEEMQATSGLFTNSLVRSIDLDLEYEPGNWTAIAPTNPEYPGEMWYTKIVTYSILVDTEPDTQYSAEDLKARFAVRLINVDGRDIWQIREWYDDVPSARTAIRIKESTWGSMKALFSE